ncbi:MAG: hypothetical protein Q8L27_00505 [archaeon]|nr:hypothetical protein [archaeon]
MKQKLSITIEEDKIKIIEEMLKEGLFRIKSHILEYSLNKFLKENILSLEEKKIT